MKATIAILPGDGIGPEVSAAAVQVLEKVAGRFGHEFKFPEAAIGGSAIDATGNPLPEATLEVCRNADAVFLGAVGGPKWSDPAMKVTPEQGLLRIRAELGVFANLRPVRTHPALHHIAPVKAHLLEGVDLMVVRELTGGIYFGEKHRDDEYAFDKCEYKVSEIERIVRMACDLAMSRRRKLTSVDKSNVLETSKLWRATTNRIVKADYPDLELEHLLVDAAAMHLLSRPADFDVIVTENMFGDILTDEASMLSGSLGLLPSASLSGKRPALFEPIHGSAPDIAGRGVANPLGAIASAAMLLDYGLGLTDEANAVVAAIDNTITAGVLPPDLSPKGQGVNTHAMTTAVIAALTGKAGRPDADTVAKVR